MSSAITTPPPHWRRSILALMVVLTVVLAVAGPVFHGRVTSAQIVTAQATQPPPPTNPPAPTQVPPPTNPPRPTDPPPPTQAPPTKVPPTEPPPTQVPPTEIPSTEVPVTEQPTEAPTNTPDPFPSTPSVPPPNAPVREQAPPTSGPDDAGDVELDCTPQASQATPIANADAWNLHVCVIPEVFQGSDSLDVTATSSDPGWRVILLDPADASTPGLLNASNNRTVIDDVNRAEDTFLLGVQRTCSALGNTTLSFELRGNQQGRELEATATLPVEMPPATDVQVDLLAAKVEAAGDTATGAFTIAWQRPDAPVCDWQVTVTLPGSGAIAMEHLSGPGGIAAVTTTGRVIVTIPATARTGEFRLEVSFPDGPPTAAGVEAQVRP